MPKILLNKLANLPVVQEARSKLISFLQCPTAAVLPKGQDRQAGGVGEDTHSKTNDSNGNNIPTG